MIIEMNRSQYLKNNWKQIWQQFINNCNNKKDLIILINEIINNCNNLKINIKEIITIIKIKYPNIFNQWTNEYINNIEENDLWNLIINDILKYQNNILKYINLINYTIQHYNYFNIIIKPNCNITCDYCINNNHNIHYYEIKDLNNNHYRLCEHLFHINNDSIKVLNDEKNK